MKNITTPIRHFLYIFKNLSLILFLLCFSFLIIKVIIVVDNIDKRSEMIVFEVERTLQTFQKTLQQLNTTQEEALKVTRSVEMNIFQRVDRIEKNIFAQTKTVVDETERLNKNLEKLTTEGEIFLQESSKTAASLRETIEDVNATITLLNQNFDCETNSFCMQNLIQETLLSARNVSQDANKTFLLLNESVPQYNAMALEITKNVEEITKNVARLTKPKWYDRLVSSIIAGAAVTASVKR